MVFLSHDVVSVFTLTVLLNVFNFDVAESGDTLQVFDTCQECIDSLSHKEYQAPCTQIDNGRVFSFWCEDTLDGDKQFTTKIDCENNCQDKTMCTCDQACWRCVVNGYTSLMQCTIPEQVFDDSCNFIPYTP
jgi:hypothetical protein